MGKLTVAKNLRLLTSYHKSIAEVCRQMGVNRQQFNKYLNGTSLPSRNMLQRICDFFGVEDYEILLPLDEFRGLIAIKSRKETFEASKSQTTRGHIEKVLAASRTDAEQLTGFYYSYRYSFSDTGKILISLIHIWPSDGHILSKRVERFRDLESGDESPFLCKYLGHLLYLQDRICIVEYESLKREEVSQTILYPSGRNRKTWFSGLNLGVSTRDDRRIGCGCVLYQYLGVEVDLKRALGGLGKFPVEHENVPLMVRNTLQTRVANDQQNTLFAPPI
ncbi:hypothetical protein WH96_06655 [Kiloniella spongiae]|uniref:HTH cro/C1-type domain-containing protein n=1 Tax=Kiloniella spongiae TaxID=1489064 RepID=A0A0H2MFI4_9PROT|nr:helix-turn-helix transcriptional regulator [Kiloniella spongiae]KLN61324.1 hypothetical protein WH96_06655 [Kiloniella spongiae]